MLARRAAIGNDARVFCGSDGAKASPDEKVHMMRSGRMKGFNDAVERDKPSGFTLIELLVVIAIIGLLISILLPSLQSARRSSRGVRCATNLRQIGVGWTIYADENRGAIVPGRPARFANPERNNYWVGNGYHFRPRWYVQMGAEAGFFAFKEPSTDPAQDNVKQVDGHDVFLCQEVVEWTNNRNYCYGYNYQFLGNARFFRGAEANGFIRFPVPIERIRATSGTVMAADAMGTAAGKALRERTDYRADGSSDLFAMGNHSWSLDPPRLTADSDFCDDNNRAPEHRSAIHVRHARKANVLYCDGHTELQTRESLGYVVRPDDRVAVDGSGATNRFFSGTGENLDPPTIR